MARSRGREIHVQGRVYQWRVREGDGELQLTVASEDQRFRIHMGGYHITIAGDPFVWAPDGSPECFVFNPSFWSWGAAVTPDMVRRLIEWCLDPNAPKELLPCYPPRSPADPLSTSTVLHIAAEHWDVPIEKLTTAGLETLAKSADGRRSLALGLWEALVARAQLPARWTSLDARDFLARSSQAPRERAGEPRWYDRDEDVALLDAPPNLRLALVLASAPRNVERAEELAAECARRFSALGVPCSPRPVWCLRDALPFLDETFAPATRPGHAIAATLVGPLKRAGAEYALPEDQDALFLTASWCDTENARRWALAIEHDVAVPDEEPFLASLRGRPLRELSDPWAPLAELASTGYALERLDARGALLVAG